MSKKVVLAFSGGLDTTYCAKYLSEELGYVLAGGDLSEISEVSEDYLLDLERKAFLKLCTKRKTLERLQSMVTKGKILRN